MHDLPRDHAEGVAAGGDTVARQADELFGVAFRFSPIPFRLPNRLAGDGSSHPGRAIEKQEQESRREILPEMHSPVHQGKGGGSDAVPSVRRSSAVADW